MREPSLCTRHLPSVLRLHDYTGLFCLPGMTLQALAYLPGVTLQALAVSLTALQSLICHGRS